MKEQPLVSIIMNCYNSSSYLEEAIQSVLKQTYSNWEIIFWDNASTDNSAQIVKGFQDSRIRYFYSSTNELLYKARNNAVSQCKGKFVGFLDCDDIWFKDKLSKQIPHFSDSIKVVYGGYEIINSSGLRTGESHNIYDSFSTSNQLVFRKTISIGAVLVDAEVLQSNLFDINYELIGDFELWFRLSLKYKFFNINEKVELSRQHGRNISHTSKRTLWINERRRFWKNFFKSSSLFKHPEILIYIFISELQALIFKR